VLCQFIKKRELLKKEDQWLLLKLERKELRRLELEEVIINTELLD
jgi:hypothetical protein